MPKVSVIIPAWNAAETIHRSLNSAIAQRFEDTEIVVVDDGSVDCTPQILAGYGTALTVLRQANRGPAAARNAGARTAKGEYLAFLDADDVWLPDKLVKTVSALELNKHCVLAYTEYLRLGEHGEVLGTSHIGPPPSMLSILSNGWEKVTSTVVMRRGTFERCGGFCEEFRSPGLEDLWTWILAREQGDFAYVAEPLVMYRERAPLDNAYRYLPTRKVFLRLLRDRYGDRSRALSKRVNHFFAALFFSTALREFRGGRPGAALRAGIQCLSFCPGYPLKVLRGKEKRTS